MSIVVLAGGMGSRVGFDLPKQLINIAGKTVLEHTLATLSAIDEVTDIVLVMVPNGMAQAQAIIERSGLQKIRAILPGGATRMESSLKAIEYFAGEDHKILFHDAVRPFVSEKIVLACLRALDFHQAVDTAVPSADTIIEVEASGCIKSIPERSHLYRGQTPQGFWLSVIREAYRIGLKDPHLQVTDDCGVVMQYMPEVPIGVVPGSEDNIKITHSLDIALADRLFQLKSLPIGGEDFRVHSPRMKGATLAVFGGSYGIGREIARQAADLGANVFSFSRTENSVHVEQPRSVAAALDTAYRATGRIDFVVNSAAQLTPRMLSELTEPEIRQQTEINYLGPIYVAQAAREYLAEVGGSLLFFTSSSHTRGRAGYSLYSSAKAAIVNLTQALAEEWIKDSIAVNCLNPERTRTPMRQTAFGTEEAATLLAPERVARGALGVLLSGCTGQVVDMRVAEPVDMFPRPRSACEGQYTRPNLPADRSIPRNGP